MPTLPLGTTIKTIGELLVAYTVLRVHHRVMHEHKIDKAVLLIMKREQTYALFGVVCIIIGYVLEINLL